MSVGHHGQEHDVPDPAIERLIAQLNSTARREYPAGRMGADDDGALSFAVANDAENGVIVIRFGKSGEWIGLGVNDARNLIERLYEGIRALSAATAPGRRR